MGPQRLAAAVQGGSMDGGGKVTNWSDYRVLPSLGPHYQVVGQSCTLTVAREVELCRKKKERSSSTIVFLSLPPKEIFIFLLS